MTAVADTKLAMRFRFDPDWRMPPLWRSEFRHVLLKYVRSGFVVPAQAFGFWEKAIERFESQEVQVDGHQVLQLAFATGCSTYDAEFVVLAQQLACPLLTFDSKLLKLFPDVAVKPDS